MDIVEIQAIYYMVAATGVLIAAVFYILNLRISQRNQEISLKNQELSQKTQELALKAQQQAAETRQAQLFMSLHDSFINVETLKIDFELMEWKWKDFDDFDAKYGSSNNLDATVKRHSLHYRLDNVGWLVKCGVVDPEWAYNQLYGFILYHWVKFKPIYYETRRREGIPNFYENFEYLAMVCDRIGRDRGASLETVRRSNPEWFPEQPT